MSAHSTLETNWTCPVCKTRQKGLIYIYYGSSAQSYSVGDEVDWREAVEKQPVTMGEISVRGWTECSNTWRMRWLKRLGLDRAEAIDWPPRGETLPSVEERRKLGCPKALHVNVKIEGNVIRGVVFPERLEELVVNEY